jgi:hypothetical protein
VSELLADHGVEVRTGTHPVMYENGALGIVPGEPIEVDAVVSLPQLEGRHIEGLPYDASGFVPFDPILRGGLWTGARPRYLFGWLGGGHGENLGRKRTSPLADRQPEPADRPLPDAVPRRAERS